MDEAKQTISDLYGRIVEIKEKAAHSEELVQVICKWCRCAATHVQKHLEAGRCETQSDGESQRVGSSADVGPMASSPAGSHRRWTRRRR